MEFKLKFDQNVFIELTNLVHGGHGWDYGEYLWSPATSTWKIMTRIKPGDIIIHSLSKGKKPRYFDGVSIVKSSYILESDEPPIPGKWSKAEHPEYKKYYKIALQDFSPFNNIDLKGIDFFNKYQDDLVKLGNQHTFYEYSTGKPITRHAERYMAQIPNSVYEYLYDFFTKNDIKFFENILVSESAKNSTKNNNMSSSNIDMPGRTLVTEERIIRDTQIIKELKSDTEFKCQICGKTITLPNGNKYAEGHHLKKLGGNHRGPDIKENVIILCPYHHTEFDYGVIGIEPEARIIKHIDNRNSYNGKKLAYERTKDDIGDSYLKYHMDNIFNKK